MRVQYEKGGLSELLRNFFGFFLKSADCKRHFLIGEREKPIPLSEGDDREFGEHSSGEQAPIAAAGEIRSCTLKFCNQLRLVKLLSNKDTSSALPWDFTCILIVIITASWLAVAVQTL